jgi:hypothetical protein
MCPLFRWPGRRPLTVNQEVIKQDHKYMIALYLLDYSRKRNIQKQLTGFLSSREFIRLLFNNLYPAHRFNNIDQKPMIFMVLSH